MSEKVLARTMEVFSGDLTWACAAHTTLSSADTGSTQSLNMICAAFFETLLSSSPLARYGNGMNNGSREELIAMTQEPTPERRKKEDYLEDENPAETREDSLVDKQGRDSFPASDPPGNYNREPK